MPVELPRKPWLGTPSRAQRIGTQLSLEEESTVASPAASYEHWADAVLRFEGILR